MPLTNETPHGGGASRIQFGDWMHERLNPQTLQSQFLIGACHVRPELAAMLAALAFGGDAQ